MAELRIKRTLITDTRKVSIDVAGAPEHRTPGGRSPIAPIQLLIEMWQNPWTSGLRMNVEIHGRRLDGPKAGQVLVRHLDGGDAVDEAPDWVRQLVDANRPSWARGSMSWRYFTDGPAGSLYQANDAMPAGQQVWVHQLHERTWHPSTYGSVAELLRGRGVREIDHDEALAWIAEVPRG